LGGREADLFHYLIEAEGGRTLAVPLPCSFFFFFRQRRDWSELEDAPRKCRLICNHRQAGLGTCVRVLGRSPTDPIFFRDPPICRTEAGGPK